MTILRIFENTQLSFHRIYLFLFFTGGYTFLNFWLGVAFFLRSTFFLIIGLFLFFLVFGFQKLLYKTIETNEEDRIQFNNETNNLKLNEPIDPTRKQHWRIKIFFISNIIFLIFYIIGVSLMQWAIVNIIGISGKYFFIVGWTMNIFTFSYSAYLSFWKKRNLKTK